MALGSYRSGNSDDDGDRAAAIRGALGIGSDEVTNYSVPKQRPNDRYQRARIIGEGPRDEARFLAQYPDDVRDLFLQ